MRTGSGSVRRDPCQETATVAPAYSGRSIRSAGTRPTARRGTAHDETSLSETVASSSSPSVRFTGCTMVQSRSLERARGVLPVHGTFDIRVTDGVARHDRDGVDAGVGAYRCASTAG
ncbi:hypothetical protein NJ76_00930 [Rhodococcus sp. IITR03]|nr:hypothetical protein NJ76_00930 [Rhodococcus sp. IITR03]